MVYRRGGEVGTNTFDFFFKTLVGVATRCRAKSVKVNIFAHLMTYKKIQYTVFGIKIDFYYIREIRVKNFTRRFYNTHLK